MAANYRQILSEISTNSRTALVTLVDGSVHAIPIDPDLEPDSLLKLMRQLAQEYGECAISIKSKQEMTESELKKEVSQTVRVLKLDRRLDHPELHGKEIVAEMEELGLRIIGTTADERDITVVEKRQQTGR